MRITFVPKDRLTVEPEIEVREPGQEGSGDRVVMGGGEFSCAPITEWKRSRMAASDIAVLRADPEASDWNARVGVFDDRGLAVAGDPNLIQRGSPGPLRPHGWQPS